MFYNYKSLIVCIVALFGLFFSADSRAASISVPGENYSLQIAPFEAAKLNHSYPETANDSTVYTPIKYKPYFKTERALFDYYPRFEPGYVSFDPQGKSYLQYGSYTVETLDSSGQWTYHDIMPFLQNYAVSKGFVTFTLLNTGQANETTIRFDNDGDAYMSCVITGQFAGGSSLRKGLLLHSTDNMATWTVYELPYWMLRFEKLDGHNQDCLNRPPVILLSSGYAPCSTYILIPEKQPDGTLAIPSAVQIDVNCMPILPHSGDGNNAITSGDKVFIVYGKVVIPPDHAHEDGAPAYAVTYDLNTKQLSTPVLIGFGGISSTDVHNWPAITIDSAGILHVVISGHHNPFRYVYSTSPNSTLSWS
ncbi:MAG: BNR-4 repeat-containing protein, partial [Kiritimatiellae bacterium]|nr:BNR-4 repeat-containing protein [Kiritimatiellia bacterium]